MEYEIKIWCTNCGDKIDTSEEVWCSNCTDTKESENRELRDEVEGLKKDIEDLESQIERLEGK